MRTLALLTVALFLGAGYALGVAATRALVVWLESSPVGIGG